MKKFLISLLSVACAVGFALTAQAAESETIKGAKADYVSFKKDMSEKLDAVDQKLTVLKEKAKAKGSSVNQKTVSELEETRTNLRTRLGEMKEDSQESWAAMKSNLAKSMADLNRKVQEALK